MSDQNVKNPKNQVRYAGFGELLRSFSETDPSRAAILCEQHGSKQRLTRKEFADAVWTRVKELTGEAGAAGAGTVFRDGRSSGTCLGILPTDGTIYAPISGTVKTVAKARHAISFANGDTEILVHVGIDTVRLNGEGFAVKVEEGQRVEEGQIVMEADLALIREKGFNPMVIVVRTKG